MVLSVSIHSLPPSHILLLAIHFASSSDLNSLRGLRALHPAILTPAVFLRVLIFLPESTPPSAYIPLLKAILGTPESFSQPHAEKPTAIDIAPVSALSEKQARRKLDKLLAHVLTFSGTQEELVSEWLIVRSQNIDTETGILSIVETLLAPFIDIQRIDRYYHGTIEVLSRLIYEHNRNEFESGDRTGNGWNAEASAAQPVKGLCQFEALNAQTAVRYLLQKTTKETAVRDIVTLVTPYLRYRDQDSKVNGWYVVWEWLCSQDLRTVLEVFIPWGGPQDCGDGFMEGYAKTGMASCYACREATSEVYDIMAKIQERIVDILGIQFDVNVASQKGIDKSRYAENVRLRSTTHDLLQPSNALTSPTPESLNLLSLLISSASILSIPLYAAAQVRISGDKEEHKTLLIRYVRSANWTIRNEREWKNIVEATRWLRNQSGIIEQLSEAECEEVLLRGLLTSCKFKLVQDLYLRNDVRILGIEKLEEAVLDAFQEFYDNASNGNKTRGGMKNADSALHILYPTYSTSDALERADRLLSATHALSFYSLTLTPGTPLLPVQIRINTDPISLLGRLLDQNPTAYTQLDKLVLIASDLHYGTASTAAIASWDEIKENDRVERRVLGMCIESALAEDDFDTAYSLIKSRLATPEGIKGSLIHTIPGTSSITQSQDESAWKACFQAGRYRSPRAPRRDDDELKRLEMQMELLAEALRICPPVACNEVLSVWIRKEEEMTIILAKEQEEDEAHAATAAYSIKKKGLGMSIGMIPGGWNSTVSLAPPTVPVARDNRIISSYNTSTPPPPTTTTTTTTTTPHHQLSNNIYTNTANNNTHTRAPSDPSTLNLFSIASGAAKALSSNISTISTTVSPFKSVGTGISRIGSPDQNIQRPGSADSFGNLSERGGSPPPGTPGQRVRKRDFVTSKFASGIGWVIGAQGPTGGGGQGGEGRGSSGERSVVGGL